ncbi:MAG: ABC transporter permease, partial [Parcubacteria group bacterium]|jgi:putative ABC transport system permease protein
VIGVVGVILVLSFGSGVKGFLVDQVSSCGSDIIQIEVKVPKVSKTSTQNASGQMGGMQITTLKLEDMEAVAKLSNVGEWYAAIMNQQVISYENKNKQVIIMGTTASVTDVDKKTVVEKGIMFSEDDDKSLRQVVVLGSQTKKDFFGESEAVGKELKIKGQTYRVIGVLKERGAAGPFNFDQIIYAPLHTVQKKLAGIDYLQMAIFKVRDMGKLDLTIAQATDVLRVEHDIENPDDDDFAVNSIVEVLEILNKIFFSVNLLLIALTSISLIVGGVGIMNVMYVSVTERTFEIGLKKSIGAKNSQILFQFLFEAIFITLLGGIIGLALGFGISKIGEIIAVNYGFALKFPITWWSALIGLGFSAGTGIIFGYFPARKASQMEPIEALRKE